MPRMRHHSGGIESQPAVMPTRPPRTPLQILPRSKIGGDCSVGPLYLVCRVTPSAIQVIAEKHGVIIVFRYATDAVSAASSMRLVVLPGLKPNHPNHRIMVPMMMLSKLCGLYLSSSLNEDSSSQRPARGPTR